MTARGDGLGNRAKRVSDTSTPPWRDAKWHKMSRHGRAIRFMETQCPIPKGVGHGKPMRLGKFQKEFLEESLAPGVDTAVLTTGRGNGKSTFGGGLAAWSVFDDEETGQPQVPVIATTITQAIRSCYGVAVQMIKKNPELLNRCNIYTGIANPRIVVPFIGDGELFPISNDPDGLQGLDPSIGIIDEIGFQPIESYASLSMAKGKREQSTILGLGTKGLNMDNALEHLRKRVHELGKVDGLVYREYSTPPAFAIDDREGWRLGNPALVEKFLRESAIAADLVMPEALFRIFRLNQSIEGADCWLGPNAAAIWDALKDLRAPEPGAATWAGVDVGLKRDSSAVVIVQFRPDGRLHAWSKLWIPTKDEPVDVTDLMGYVRTLHKTFDLRGVAYDPRFFDVPAKMLSDERIRMVEVPQSPERMTPIIGELHDLVKGGGIRHNGDTALRAHVLAAKARINERGFTLEKGKSRGRIDAAIALSLATDLAIRAKPKRKRKPRYAHGG